MLFQDYSYELTHLRVASRKSIGSAPHKPVLLLTLMDGIENGEISSK